MECSYEMKDVSSTDHENKTACDMWFECQEVEETSENYVHCQSTECAWGFCGVCTSFVANCRNCGVRQNVIPNPGQEQEHDMNAVYNMISALRTKMCLIPEEWVVHGTTRDFDNLLAYINRGRFDHDEIC
jgi:hypothetical protein